MQLSEGLTYSWSRNNGAATCTLQKIRNHAVCGLLVNIYARSGAVFRAGAKTASPFVVEAATKSTAAAPQRNYKLNLNDHQAVIACFTLIKKSSDDTIVI